MAVGTQMQQRRATAATWGVSNYILAAGELGVTTDTGIIKIGDGVNTWTNLSVAFGSQYLPLLGKAEDSKLLDGISASGFVKMTDTAASATPDKVALRTSDGRLKAANGTESSDLTTFGQQLSAIAESRRVLVSRTVTTGTTIESADVGKMVRMNHAVTTTQLLATLPANTATAIPTGGWVDICVIGEGGAKIVGGVGVTVEGPSNVFPPFGVVRALKINTDQWLCVAIGHHRQSRLPKIRVYRNGTGRSYTSGADRTIAYDVTDASQSYNPDNEWFSIPAAGLATAKRIVVNKTGEYIITGSFSSTIDAESWLRIVKYTADDTYGPELAVCDIRYASSATWTGRLTAGESVGALIHPAATGTDIADGTFGHRNDYTITRIGD